MAPDPLPAEGSDKVGLAAAGQAEAEQIVTAADEVGVQQRRDLAADFVRKPLFVERLKGFLWADSDSLSWRWILR